MIARTSRVVVYMAMIIQFKNANASRACASEQTPPVQKVAAQNKETVEPALATHIIQRNQHTPISVAIYELYAPRRLTDRKYIAGRVRRVMIAVASWSAVGS